MNEQQRERLVAQVVARIADGELDDGAWEAVAAAAAGDAMLWRDVALAQRDQATLDAVGARLTATAERVPLPLPGVGRVERAGRRDVAAGEARAPWWDALRGWGGWAVAALITVAFFVNALKPPRPAIIDDTGGLRAGVIPVSNAKEAFDAYLDKGREEGTVLTPAPRRVLVESRPNPAGEGIELIFVHQIMERTVVPDLYRVGGQDERGRPVVARWERPIQGRM